LTHENDERFTEYYSRRSQSAITLKRIRSIRDSVLRVANCEASTKFMLDVADIGCGARTQSFLWADLDHNVHGLDVNQPLLEVARQRTSEIRLLDRFSTRVCDHLRGQMNLWMSVCCWSC